MEQAKVIEIGTGIYTVTEISQILRLPYHKVNRWLNKYWDSLFRKELNSKYVNTINRSKAVTFYTLIEFYVVYQLIAIGVPIEKIIKSRIELTKLTKSKYPFAQKNIIQNIGSDGGKVFFDMGDNDILSLDGTKQLNINFIKEFYRNIDFNNELLAVKYWPLGKSKNIIVDPTRQFGHPVIGHTNIFPETINNLYKGGENMQYIAEMYDINEDDVRNAIEYCNAA